MRDAIIVQDLGKRFNRYHAEKPATFMEAALSGLRRMKPVEHFWALRHISFTVAPGEILGIIGHNGAGKSTLLQLIGKVGRPDEGHVRVNGGIGALLDLGAGFHGDLTGRENVFVNAIVAGLTRREVAQRLEAIVEFAELANSIDNPVRTYSTGMTMRLAFSVVVHTIPKVLLVDEFLSVGDVRFQAKCRERITQLKNDGCAIVLISHDAEQVEQLCEQAMWLRKGQIAACGEPEVVAGQYIAEMRSETQQRTPLRPPQLSKTGVELRVNENRFGSLEAEITDVRLLPAAEIRSGDALEIEIEYLSSQRIDAPNFGISISRKDGEVCFDTSISAKELSLSSIQGHGKITLHLDRLDLSGDQYFINLGIYEKNWDYAYDYHWHVYPLLINSTIQKSGLLCPPYRWEISQAQVSMLKRL